MPRTDLKYITIICEREGFEFDEVKDKCELLFDSFRAQKWLKDIGGYTVTKTDEEIQKEMAEIRYTFLDLFWRPLDENREKMVEMINRLCTMTWFDELLNHALNMLLLFTKSGKTYKKLLEAYYFKPEYEDSGQRRESTHMSDSTFYDYRKEAVALLGISFWIYAKQREYKEIAKGNVPYHPIYPENISDKKIC